VTSWSGAGRPFRFRSWPSSPALALLLPLSVIVLFPQVYLGHGNFPLPTNSPLRPDPAYVGARPHSLAIVPAGEDYALVGSPQTASPSPATMGNALVYPGLYNAASGSLGSVRMEGTGAGGVLRTTVNFSRVAPDHDGVVGFSELQYGVKPWCARAPCPTAPMAPTLRLPIPLSELPPLQASVSYSTYHPENAMPCPFDLAFDLWFTQHANQTSAGPGDLETMFWLYYSDPSLLPGTPIGERSIPVEGASPLGGPWWNVYVQDGDPARAGHPWTVVYLVLMEPRPSASVRLDLSAMIQTAESVLVESFPGSWGHEGRAGTEDPGALYLNDIELGSEFLPSVTQGFGPAQYGWSLSGYSLLVGGPAVPSRAPALPWGQVGTTATASGLTILGWLALPGGPFFLGFVRASDRRRGKARDSHDRRPAPTLTRTKTAGSVRSTRAAPDRPVPARSR
jgi:hypothetical protein